MFVVVVVAVVDVAVLVRVVVLASAAAVVAAARVVVVVAVVAPAAVVAACYSCTPPPPASPLSTSAGLDQQEPASPRNVHSGTTRSNAKVFADAVLFIVYYSYVKFELRRYAGRL